MQMLVGGNGMEMANQHLCLLQHQGVKGSHGGLGLGYVLGLAPSMLGGQSGPT